MKTINVIIKSIRQLCQMLMISVILIEFTGIFMFDTRYYWAYRYLFYSNDPIVNELNASKEFWKYKPNSEIRFVAAYQNLFNINIEYDCSFETNKFGFIDTGEIENRADYLVLGDSYTEGHGGCPWLTAETLYQDAYLSKYSILNGGLQGTGILQFEQVLEYFEAELNIENLVIIAISNDFKRGNAFSWPTDSECYKNGRCGRDDWWHYISIESSDEELLDVARSRSMVSEIDFSDRLLRWSFVYYIFEEYKKIFLASNDESLENKNDDYAPYIKNFEALERINKKYPSLKIILVPQRDEVGFFGRKNRDSELVEKYLKVDKYNFHWCELTASDYMTLDGHPNKDGYIKLFNCLKNTIDK